MPASTIPERIEALRASMRQHGVSHYLVPSSDEHLNEYLPAWHQRRPWLSGFTGSAGDLLVGMTADETWLFTDGRYHLQAERELEGSGIGLQKLGSRGSKSLREVLEGLAGRYREACAVGYDPWVLSLASAEELSRVLEDGGAKLRPLSPPLVDGIWTDRPAPPETPLLVCPPEWTGRTMKEKVDALRASLQRRNADATAVVKLDQIAWLTNLRSTDDIPYNPVFEAYLYVDADRVHLFLHGARVRLPAGFGNDLPGFAVREYGEFPGFLASVTGRRVLLDPEATTRGVFDALSGSRIIRAASPLDEAKAVKNEAERACMARASLLASVGKTRALLWLAAEIEAGRRVTEASFRDRIEGLYRELEGYRQLSFPTIAATGEHGAIVHYAGADETELRPGELFLVDSGIHLDGGTTDDTRTVTVRAPTPEQRAVYTRVLKAHIAGASQVFPEDAPGAALDAVTRSPLWSARLQYEHGTGHGVGAFLNVHEGPFSLTEARGRPAAGRGLKTGMITSVEPGYYRPGFGGVRLESLYLVTETGEEVDGRKWLCLVPLTWIPFDPRLIDLELLDETERAWLQVYHRGCLERLEPHLSADEAAGLRRRLS
ncbi:MAG: M24 family metallopeptidase [Deltaproteobacteria bacterium]|nr:M24 family metallopeptidase [Deltaproteobacteria bacterium]